MLKPREPYRDIAVLSLTIYDLQDPVAVSCLHAERTRWQGLSDIEALDQLHFVLVVYRNATAEVKRERP